MLIDIINLQLLLLIFIPDDISTAAQIFEYSITLFVAKNVTNVLMSDNNNSVA